MGWIEFAIAYMVFFVSHSVPLRPPVRARLTAMAGRHGFILLYSLVSVVVLGWLIFAAGRAPYIALWDYHPWQNRVPPAAMAVVVVILAMALGRPNPFSIAGSRNESFDPTQPGIVRWIRHPVLIAFTLWAGAHMVPNGDLAHVILFCSFAGFALLGIWFVDKRRKKEMGDAWNRMFLQVLAVSPFSRPASLPGFSFRLFLAVAVYAGLLVLHPMVFGVSPLP